MSNLSKIVFATILLLVISCTKEDTKDYVPADTGDIELSVSHKVDNQILVFDTIRYQNAAGNKFSVTRLQYYISSCRFHKADGSSLLINNITYVDARDGISTIHFTGVPVGNYTGISFLIGIDSAQNKSNALPDTENNINMAWPDVMGGGYHFIKLEGHYLNTLNAEKGFTVHLGTYPALVTHNILNATITIVKNQTSTHQLVMNINEWFTAPYNYNFNTDGNYTMGNGPLMDLIKNNGKDVFTIY